MNLTFSYKIEKFYLSVKDFANWTIIRAFIIYFLECSTNQGINYFNAFKSFESAMVSLNPEMENLFNHKTVSWERNFLLISDGQFKPWNGWFILVQNCQLREKVSFESEMVNLNPDAQ